MPQKLENTSKTLRKRLKAVLGASPYDDLFRLAEHGRPARVMFLIDG